MPTPRIVRLLLCRERSWKTQLEENPQMNPRGFPRPSRPPGTRTPTRQNPYPCGGSRVFAGRGTGGSFVTPGLPLPISRWAHSGLSTPVFGVGYGPIQIHRHCCLGGPIQNCRRRYSLLAMGPFRYIDIAALVGPFKIIDAGIRRWLWAHSDTSTLLPRWAHSELSTPVFGFGHGPIQIYRQCC